MIIHHHHNIFVERLLYHTRTEMRHKNINAKNWDGGGVKTEIKAAAWSEDTSDFCRTSARLVSPMFWRIGSDKCFSSFICCWSRSRISFISVIRSSHRCSICFLHGVADTDQRQSVCVLVLGCLSGRFVKQKQWERWRAKRKLVSVSKHRVARGSPGISPQEKFWDRMWKILQSSVFLAFLNTLTMGTAFPRVPLEMTPGLPVLGF